MTEYDCTAEQEIESPGDFSSLNLIEPLLEAVRKAGYSVPTPIQRQAIPAVIKGRDVLGCAQTGTGKTAAFALPILQRFISTPRRDAGVGPRALILTPTRELALQVTQSFDEYGASSGLSVAVVYGGVGYKKQLDAIRDGIDILIATPGRLLDHIGSGALRLDSVEVFILDEADRMMDMGFIQDIRRLIRVLPRERQNLLFSATLPDEIRRLADEFLRDPVSVSVSVDNITLEAIEQWAFYVEQGEKIELLSYLLAQPEVTRALVFTRTKMDADRVLARLTQQGVRAGVLHGDKTQESRERTLARFKGGQSRVLVATDLASRGLDIDDISHVFNLDVPDEPESYVHRIGRTGRAGAAGIAVTLCAVQERPSLQRILWLLRRPLLVAEGHPFASPLPPPLPSERKPSRAARKPGRAFKVARPSYASLQQGRISPFAFSVSLEMHQAAAIQVEPWQDEDDVPQVRYDEEKPRRKRSSRGKSAAQPVAGTEAGAAAETPAASPNDGPPKRKRRRRKKKPGDRSGAAAALPMATDGGHNASVSNASSPSGAPGDASMSADDPRPAGSDPDPSAAPPKKRRRRRRRKPAGDAVTSPSSFDAGPSGEDAGNDA